MPRRIQGGTRDAPGDPNSSIFKHFSAKKLQNYLTFGVAPLQENPWSATGWSMQNRRQQHTTFNQCEYVYQQWRIQDFPDRTGASTPEFGAKTCYLTRILPKTEWKWKKLDCEGGHAFLGPSPDPQIVKQPHWFSSWSEITSETRMHSSRMCTARSLTVSHSIWWGKGSAQPPSRYRPL